MDEPGPFIQTLSGRRVNPFDAAPDDIEGIRDALLELHGRYADGGLPSVELEPGDEERLSRRARVEEMAELIREVA